MNEIAVIKQLPIITEQIKQIGEELDKRLTNLNLDNLICNEETKKEVKELRTTLGKELKNFETQREEIKTKIMEPYELFNKTYEDEIKKKYESADELLKNKISEVESSIKHNTEVKMKEYFEEYKKSKSIIQDNYLEFHELNLKIDLSCLTKTGELAKKVKDEIKKKIDEIARDIETILSMQHNNEILVEYLKTKDLSCAIKEVNDRYFVLETLKNAEEKTKESAKLEEQLIERVDEVLQAPTESEIIEGQMTIDDFEENTEEILELTFTVRSTLSKLKQLKQFLENGGYDYE